MEGIVNKLLACYHQTYKKKKLKERRITTPLPVENFTVVYFDGVSQAHGASCGAGGIIVFSSSLQVSWKLNIGVGSNTKGELVGL